MSLTIPASVSMSSGSCKSPPGWAGQPMCTQRLEMTVTLGMPFETPLLRTNAVRLLTSAGSSRVEGKTAVTHWLRGKFEIGPRSTSS